MIIQPIDEVYIPDEEHIDLLYEDVLRGFQPTPPASGTSTPSNAGYWESITSPSMHGASDLVLDNSASALPLSRSSSVQTNGIQTPIESIPTPFNGVPTNMRPSTPSASTARRRPLPQPPGGPTAAIPLTPSQLSLQDSQLASQLQSPISLATPSVVRRLTLAKNFTQPVVYAPVNESGAGPAPQNGELLLEPGTEYPGEEDAPLPEYVPDLQQDPNASHFTTQSAMPTEQNDQSAIEAEVGFRRMHSNDTVSSFPTSRDGETTIDDFGLLRRPSSSARFVVDQHDPYDPNFRLSLGSGVHSNGTFPDQSDIYTNDGNSVWDDHVRVNSRRNTDMMRQITNFEPPHLNLVADVGDPNDFDERRFINLSLLSNSAVQLKDKVPRNVHVKEGISYQRAFTGKDIVSTLHSIICRELFREAGTTPTDRRAAILVARSLQNSLFFMEVEWGSKQLQDSVEDVYMFLDDTEGSSDTPIERTELPTGVVTFLAKCYSPWCDIGTPGLCYAYDCPRKRGLSQLPSLVEVPVRVDREEWSRNVPQKVLSSLSENEVMRQTIIRKIISKEEQYIEDLDLIIEIFIKGLRSAQPPVMTPLVLEEFVEEVFGNILDIRDCNHRLLDFLSVRQREEHPIIQRVGDIFLEAATEFRNVYPTYVGHHPLAEKRMKQEMEQNPEFRIFLEKCTRQLCSRPGTSSSMRPDLKLYLNRPAEHLQRYPSLLNAVYQETEADNPDCEYLVAAMSAIQALQDVARLRTFQSAMGKGSTGRWQWHDLVSDEIPRSLGHDESQRQSNIFELIQTEMVYVRDLENIETMYVRPLRNAEPPIIPPDRIDQFLRDVFHNYDELHSHHRRLVDNLHEIQREEHPQIKSITAAVFDAVLNFREAYMEYIPNYPIAEYRIDDEVAQNESFRAFFNNSVRHPDAHRLDMKNFINRPIPRLLRYELLLKQILSLTPPYHEDRRTIPAVIDEIKSLGKETEPGVTSAKQKVELWKYNSNIIFKPGEHVDMDLLNDQRSLIYTGKLLRQPESGLNGWTELFVMLFDNYLVMTKPTEKDGVTKYKVVRRPIPLDLLTLVNFTDSGIQRNTSILRNLRPQSAVERERSDSVSISSRHQDPNDARIVYPCTIHHNGRLGGPYILYAETAATRSDWKKKLDEATGLRKVVQESNKVFEIESLSVDTFLSPPINTGPNASAWHDGTFFTGKVTCSVPFNTPDGRGLVAIGCAEGVWIGYRHDSRSLRRVLHLKMVTQCAVLDDFGLFIVLSDKVLYAYHLEALVPTIPGSANASQTPQRIHNKDVQFFSVGILHGRTMIIYMKKRGSNDSVFYAVEPVVDKINEPPKTSGSLFARKSKQEWFRLYKEFTFADAYDLIFLKAKIAVLCAKGFMIMDLIDYRSVTIPQRDNSNHPYLAKRCETCRPLGMFRPNANEFLLCYDEFGLFVDRHGNASRSTGIIEWEGMADKVAMHHPYILLFDSRFIEVRHVETGRLVQIISGIDVRCVWDGRTLDGGVAIVPQQGADDRMVQEPRVHAVMNIPDPPMHAGVRNIRGTLQHVFELFPTIPLYLPGSLASPSTAPYFPLSFSPPRSPPLRAHHI